MAFDRKETAKALKILASTPREIQRQQEIYKEAMAQIRADEATGNWSRNGIESRKQKVTEERNRICNALARSMAPALDYVAQNNNYADTETINFQDPKLQDALRTIEFMGKDLSYSDQASILSAFRGDVGALRVIEKAYRKNNLYMKDAAAEMQKPIPTQAISEMAEVLAFQRYAEAKGGFDFPIDRARWTMDAFERQLDRLGLADDTDPYSAVLSAAADHLRADMDAAGPEDQDDPGRKAQYQAQLLRLQLAMQDVKKAHARGENPGPVLNRELGKLETWKSATVPAEE